VKCIYMSGHSRRGISRSRRWSNELWQEKCCRCDGRGPKDNRNLHKTSQKSNPDAIDSIFHMPARRRHKLNCLTDKSPKTKPISSFRSCRHRYRWFASRHPWKRYQTGRQSSPGMAPLHQSTAEV
jgi:hypothetical protein